ncbi:MAG: DUF521 domain-containing protein [Gammaproteobacteria bacterium]|nr:DUF521 domain-containing protein [Gammaproteobacteria bacterium]
MPVTPSTGAAEATALVQGSASGSLLVSTTGLSFWGGVDPQTGVVIDQHHPLAGNRLTGKILAVPGGRGSSSGSGALIELLLNNQAPAALIFTDPELILTLGVLVAETLFQKSIPVLCVSEDVFGDLGSGDAVVISNGTLSVIAARSGDETALAIPLRSDEDSPVVLQAEDKRYLAGDYGKAAQVAMQIIARMAQLQGADSLLDVTQVHIDACVYNGPSSLQVAEQLLAWGAEVKVPTTLNSISVDQQRWHSQGVEASFATAAVRLGEVFVEMGAQRSFTCAPYLLGSVPALNQQVAWAESNAVTFANSVIGARTLKYPDFLDVCIALTGRAPAIGCHTETGRMPTIVIEVEYVDSYSDAFWPLLGYHTGLLAANELPMISGLEKIKVNQDELKSFSAAFATTSSTPMFHIAGVTPEAPWALSRLRSSGVSPPVLQVSESDLAASFRELNTIDAEAVSVVALGNPHFSLTECETLAGLCAGRIRRPDVEIMVTMGRDIYAQAVEAGYVERLERFGVQFITDTCWCMIVEPVIPPGDGALMTNSAKYAHYGPGLIGRKIRFDSLVACVEVASLPESVSV